MNLFEFSSHMIILAAHCFFPAGKKHPGKAPCGSAGTCQNLLLNCTWDSLITNMLTKSEMTRG